MSVLNPNALVVPALPYYSAGKAMAVVRTALIDAGIRPESIQSTGVHTEYELGLQSNARRDIEVLAEEQRHLLERVGGLVVVNHRTEQVVGPPPERKAVCDIPYSVGHFATTLIRVANEVYGEGSGRVFLSHNYPVGDELFGTDATHRSVSAARKRLMALYPLRPVALHGDMSRAIRKFKGEPEPEQSKRT